MDEESRSLPLEPPDPEPPAPPCRPLAAIAAAASAPDLSKEDVACVGCGYNLRGLEPGGVCPECGLDISRSLHGDQLVYSSGEYLNSLCRGVKLIFGALIARVALTAMGIVAGIVLAANLSTIQSGWMNLVTGGLMLIDAATSLVLILGWWFFSTPDPSITSANRGDTVRKVVRITVIISGVANVANSGGTGQNLSPAPGMALLAGALALLVMAAWVTSFFASMVYIRWLAKRIPSERVDRDAKRLMWLGPLLMIVGAFCLMLGPVVAFVLYIILIYRLRQEILVVQAEQARRFG